MITGILDEMLVTFVSLIIFQRPQEEMVVAEKLLVHQPLRVAAVFYMLMNHQRPQVEVAELLLPESCYHIYYI